MKTKKKIPQEIKDKLDLADNLYLAGDLDSAEEIYEKVVSNYKNARAFLNYGDILEAKGKLEEAKKAYRKAIKIKPNYTDALCNLGNIYYDTDEMDEAEVLYRKVLRIDKKYQYAYNNLGNILRDKTEYHEAAELFETAIKLDKEFSDPYYNLGNVYKDLEDFDKAVSYYRKYLEMEPNDDTAKHLLDSLQGQNTHKAPEGYVSSLFDDYSGHFEKELVQDLGYEVPAKLFKTFKKAFPEKKFQNALDLGCGTGLAGKEFASVCDNIEGIDLAKRMLSEAEKKNIYSKLHNQDIADFLNKTKTKFDLFISTDVFIYIGKLDEIFAAAQKASTDRACFAFSVETSPEEDYSLLKSGRYAHSKKYIKRLAREYGFSLVCKKKTKIRKESEDWIKGKIFILEKKN
jgi:predicted TPR repeat methyltransferase